MRLLRLSRRAMFRAAGVSIGLPLLDAMLPVGLRGEQRAAQMSPKRMLLIGRGLGIHAPYFFPEQAGKEYQPSRYLKELEPFRQDITVFSGMSHQGYGAGHHTGAGLLTGVGPEGMRAGDIRNTISLDQEVASRVGTATRLAYLAVGGDGLSWNQKGLKVPSETRARVVFKQLFLQGTRDEVEREMRRIRAGQSILDGVREQAKSLGSKLGPGDRTRIDLLLSTIREAETRLQQDQQWLLKPKPSVEAAPPPDDYLTGARMLEREGQWFDLVHLALQTDSTRVISFLLYSHEAVDVNGITIGHHDASHHGQDQQKIDQLAAIEAAEIKLFAAFLHKMKASVERGLSLLDRTQVFYASNLGNASAHTCDNLPVLVAGGGFKHAGHVVFDRANNKPLSNLFVRMLQQMDIELDRFGSSTGVLGEV